MTAPEGLLLLDKPAGPTSHDVVARVRRLLGQRRVGHTGTLDPMATGLLAVLVGRATRLSRYLPASPKSYEGVIRLGLRTDTDDVTGRVLERFDGPIPGIASTREAAAGLVGRIAQRPPDVSARRVGGERLYRLARRGAVPDVPPTQVEVIRFEIEPGDRPDEWAFSAEVSTGTYLRAIARDLGASLGCGGALASLRRTGIGELDLSQAAALPADDATARALALERIVPIDSIPIALPGAEIATEAEVRRFLAGAPAEPVAPPPDGEVAVRSTDGSLVGIGNAAGGRLHPRVVLPRDSGGHGGLPPRIAL